MPIHTNDTNKIIYKELSYKINGILFRAHNELGRYCRERQYADKLEELWKENKINYKREKKMLGDLVTGNIPDFCIEDKILLEIKAKSFIVKEDYYQIQRYLQTNKIKLGLLVNFRNRYLKPIRIIRINS
ncbi:GxxExxY protein [Candidatus Falkowbacteria bacterium]|nr:GxxExxY protein [Candidatus Falkowbacteria bacterium]